MLCLKGSSVSVNSLSANPTKRSNTLKQFVGICLGVVGHFLRLALKVLKRPSINIDTYYENEVFLHEKWRGVLCC